MILTMDPLFPRKGFEYLQPYEFFANHASSIHKTNTWILAPTRRTNGYFSMTEELIEWYELRELDTFWGFTGIQRVHDRAKDIDSVVAEFETGDDGVLYKLTW